MGFRIYDINGLSNSGTTRGYPRVCELDCVGVRKVALSQARWDVGVRRPARVPSAVIYRATRTGSHTYGGRLIHSHVLMKIYYRWAAGDTPRTSDWIAMNIGSRLVSSHRPSPTQVPAALIYPQRPCSSALSQVTCLLPRYVVPTRSTSVSVRTRRIVVVSE